MIWRERVFLDRQTPFAEGQGVRHITHHLAGTSEQFQAISEIGRILAKCNFACLHGFSRQFLSLGVMAPLEESEHVGLEMFNGISGPERGPKEISRALPRSRVAAE